ncbi:molybdate ABC transporter substrate-binding protein [Mycobacterium manitobense]|uniref:Molybdate ABC transporter substrate-binding protein n=1 Tax=[Mycobacterium] manitobense TaxID=190147 RepID=A0A9X3BYW9_9MYCO|nr:molybdate ABC transporter substrate-binding protein [[Mycobacterium] manitobense]MCV7173701.1 molybdate ABC transporter substrate-binding protein [[Mycobacterium] manitobense]
MRSIVGITATLSAVALVAACSSSQTDSSSASAGTPITVFAAASLTTTFTQLGARFERDNPGATVSFNFAGSSDLATQLTQGAPADVFASADVNNMTKAVDAGLVAGEPVNFATNSLTIVTQPGNPTGIATFADLAKPGTQVVVCAPQVPCGSATEKVERATGVTLTPVSEESAVTDVLGKVTSGQADAGLVYVTDAVGARDDVTAIPFPEAGDALNTYPITVLEDSPNPIAAQTFIDLVTGPAGQEALAAAGFAAP